MNSCDDKFTKVINLCMCQNLQLTGTECLQCQSIVSELMLDNQRVIKFSLMNKTTIKNDIVKTERLCDGDGTDYFIIEESLWVVSL